MSFPFYFPFMNDKEFRIKNSSYSDFLHPYILVEKNIVGNKNNVFMCCFQYLGFDLDLVSLEDKIGISKSLNKIMMSFDEDWGISFENARKKLGLFEEDDFIEDPVAIEFEKDRNDFFKQNSYFESFKYITICYQPARAKDKMNKILYSGISSDVSFQNELNFFKKRVDEFYKDLKGIFSDVSWLENEELLTYLHFTTSLIFQKVVVPDIPIDLDVYLHDVNVNTEYPMKIGKNYVLNASINDLSESTKIDMLRILDRVNFEYRFVSRFIPFSKENAFKFIKKRQEKYNSKIIGFTQALAARKGESPLLNTEYIALRDEAGEALDLAMGGYSGWGYLTSTIQVYGEDFEETQNNFNVALKILRNGLPCREETLNCFQCWLSSLPGDFWANSRKSFISTFNLSHIIFCHSSWNGFWSNSHLEKLTGNSHPLMITMSDDFSPFFLNLNVEDLGHTVIAGQTGGGKSTLLCAIELSYKRYPQSTVFIFDKDKSCYFLTSSVQEGAFYEPGVSDGEEGALIFQPLRMGNDPEDKAFAFQWVCDLVSLNGKKISPIEEKEIQSVIDRLAEMRSEEQTLSNFYLLLQAPAIKEIIKKYTIDGSYGFIFDGDKANLSDSKWIAFEMGKLMSMKNEVLLPALSYLFRQIDKRLVVGGDPSIIVLDEAWVFTQTEFFQEKIREWLKTFRKKNASVILCFQEIADVTKNSNLVDVIINSCQTKIYLANPNAMNIADSYYRFGLNDIEIEKLCNMRPKREYMFKNPYGSRVFDLCLTPKQLHIIRGE